MINRKIGVFLFSILILIVNASSAQFDEMELILVAKSVEDTHYRNERIYALIGTEVRIGAVVRAGGIYYSDVSPLSLDGMIIPAETVRPLSAILSDETDPQWFQMEAISYTFALIPGYDEPYTPEDSPEYLDWLEYPLYGDGGEIVLFRHSPQFFPDDYDGLGTLHYGCRAALNDGTELKSDINTTMIVSYRRDDTLAGYVSEGFNMPYIFGATKLSQAFETRMVGMDCADLIIYGINRAGMEMEYRGPRYVLECLEFVEEEAVPAILSNGLPLVLHFGQHVTVFYEDANSNDNVDGGDFLIHILGDHTSLTTVSNITTVYPLIGYMTIPSDDNELAETD